jgi:hypothetical protein
MPNWCSNTIEIQGTKEQVNKFVSFLDEQSGKEWFDFFHPCPQELKDVGDVSLTAPVNEDLFEKYGASDWYTWSANNWGTKWNCDAQDWIKVESPNGDEASVSFWFDSPWGPPIALYQFIESNFTLQVTASYLEEGMQFVGQFVDGEDDYYEYTDLESLEDIPESLVEEWNLVDSLESREEWDDE